MTTKVWPTPIPKWFWSWACWYLGRDQFEGRRRDPKVRPKDAPKRIPFWAWARLAVLLGKDPPKPPPPPPVKADPALVKARALLAFCRRFDGPYVFAAEHDGSFADDTVHSAFDCSSSTSFALWTLDLLGSDRAHNSTWFMSWGLAGRGRYVTVHANAEHVWIEFNLPADAGADAGYHRFDTSPHRDGPRGPRVRSRTRFDSGFYHRHPAGL